MRERDGHLDALTGDEQPPADEHVAGSPFHSAFGAGHAEVASSAVDRARQAVTIAGHVFDQVKEQAVYALLAEGVSMGAIVRRTGIPKREVARISRRLGKDGDQPGAHATAAPSGSVDAVRFYVRAAWGHR